MTDLELVRFEISYSLEQWLAMLPRTALVSVVIRDANGSAPLVLGNDEQLRRLLEKCLERNDE